jgi:hypothetical protein
MLVKSRVPAEEIFLNFSSRPTETGLINPSEIRPPARDCDVLKQREARIKT